VVEALLAAGAIPILTDWRGVGPLAIAESKKNGPIAARLRTAIGPQSSPGCERGRLTSESAEGVQHRFLPGHPVRVREAIVDALKAMGFFKDADVLTNLPSMKHVEVHRNNPQIAGTGVRVSIDTKKNFVGGRFLQYSWSVPVLDEAECLLALLGNQPSVEVGTARCSKTSLRRFRPREFTGARGIVGP
jgi:hypothetical protein